MIGLRNLANKLAALAILALALFPVFAGLSYFANAYREAEADRAFLLERFDRARAIASTAGASPAAAGSFDVKNFLLGAGTPAMLSAGLQSKLRDIAMQRGVEVLQASELKPEEIDGLTRLGIRVEMTGPAQGVHAVLQQIAQSVPWLFADNIQIRSGYTDNQAQAIESPLSVALDVFGFVEAEAKP